MAGHASVEAAHAAGLSDRKGRKVVVQHERLLLVLEFDRIEKLRIARTAESEGSQDVCRATIEESRTVDDRRDAPGFCKEWADLVEAAAVNALAFL